MSPNRRKRGPLRGVCALVMGLGAVQAGTLRGTSQMGLGRAAGGLSGGRRDLKNSTNPIEHKTYSVPTTNQVQTTPGTQYTAEALADEIKRLPGLTQKLNFRQFSGYLPITPTKRIFYWFVESQYRPATDPLVFWTNGGPGCSGLFGFLNENGPFRPTEKGKGLVLNPFAWNQVANMLFVEQPVGVGFSQALDNKLSVTDAAVAEDNYLVLQAFLNRFKHLRNNDLYLSGESYAGHYIPQLARKVLDRNAEGKQAALKLKGFAVGNPLTNPVENMVGMFEAFWGNQLVPHAAYHQWETICAASADIETYYTPNCVSLENTMFNYVAGLNPYALDYPVCTKQGKEDGQRRLREGYFAGAGRNQRFKMRSKMLKGIVGNIDDLLPRLDEEEGQEDRNATASHATNGSHAANATSTTYNYVYQPCLDDWAQTYLNRKDVKAAIHANTSIPWADCSDQVFFAYSDEDKDVPQEPHYDYFIKQNKKLRILVFSGDDDSVCATAGTQLWISERKWQPVSEWQPWGFDQQVAGYVQKYEGGNFTFATVHGAGHEVPAYKPQAALALFNAYLANQL